ncbi:uncharacterized protein [Fopius arisanus]|uniref:Uncharacterized protein n=1 Tax=Fopius arisanus TaxID=64838 RepID=A0A9R1TDY6_9HYME|nr:PREDICTED: uncharacterized protein LOC105269222 [Fopius arisanus]
MKYIHQKRDGQYPIKCPLIYPGMYPWDTSEYGIAYQLHLISEILASEKENIRVVIKECIQQYEILLKCRDLINGIFGPVIFWMMGTNAIVLCALIFQLSQMWGLSTIQIISIVNYLIMKLTQTYLYTWSGTYLITQSEKYRQAIYHIDWLRERSIMPWIVIMLSQRSFYIKAFGFIISMDVFVMIFKTAISYFGLLKTMEQRV